MHPASKALDVALLPSQMIKLAFSHKSKALPVANKLAIIYQRMLGARLVPTVDSAWHLSVREVSDSLV